MDNKPCRVSASVTASVMQLCTEAHVGGQLRDGELAQEGEAESTLVPGALPLGALRWRALHAGLELLQAALGISTCVVLHASLGAALLA